MIRRLSTFVLTLIALASVVSTVCYAQSQTLMTRHTRDEVTSRIAPLVGHLSATQKMEITLVLPHRNQSELEQFLNDLQDPTHPSYRHFLTVEQFTEKYGPSREDYASVQAWAKQNGFEIKATSRNRMILRVSGSVQNIENALHVTMGLYQHPTENRTFFAPDREPAPEMGVRLWAISGLDNFSRPQPMYVKRDPNTVNADTVIGDATTGSCPSKSFCGSDMRAAYYTSTGGTLTGTGQSLGLFEFIGTDLVDLTTYFTNAGQTNNVPVTLKSVDTQSTSCVASKGCDDTEQTLDMTQALGMAPGMSSLVMYIGTGGLAGQTLDDPGILNGMATASPLNAQLSCSWAWKPTDNTTDDPFFQQFAAQGQNFFTAAGDSGKWAAGGFVWPADDPFVTSVGGTDLTTASAGGAWASETGWADTGGGTSTNNFAIPSWQVAAAAGCAKCSQTLRNGPDVSANANFTFYVCADQTTCTANNFGGTSFAAPMWAGFLALVNQQSVANGQPTLGFVNPALYTILGGSGYTADFHDITSGGNSLGSTVGYDLSTGIGSPNGQALVNALTTSGGSGDFTLALAPKTISVARGASGHSRATTTVSGGFSSAIALTASGMPKGVQVRFNPTSITGAGAAAVQVRVSSTTVVGTYTITVTGTGGGKTHTATLTLSVH
ncbi:MAG TPA: S53 family serine peptidase [Candidatus Dormibacteraeota bacterium]|nr:S53 family serine peptidase [Candidatus Dormibacteraeota bacterium]